MPEHPRTAELRDAMQICLPLAVTWSGTIFRYTNVRYANRTDLLSGAGSRRCGQRWNPPGIFNCVYGSLEPHTATAEALQMSTAFGIPPSKMRPRVFVAIDLQLQAVLDLREPRILATLAVTEKQLVSIDWLSAQDAGEEPLTQAIGRIAWEAKLEGLLVPSARVVGAGNLVLFPGCRRKGSSWRIQGARDLPKSP
jgi:RES domain-containing protein